MKALTTALFLSMATVPANAGTILEPPAGTPRVEFSVNKQSAADDAPLRIEGGLVLVDVEVSAGSGDYYVFPRSKPDWLTYDPERRQFWGHSAPGRALSEIIVMAYDRKTKKLARGILDFQNGEAGQHATTGKD